ncbi:CoA-binding protein [Candidatus Micrarchaeota archaeon]|nr:CoA-binding protein [Candidatus Micrarchaeota archaeon]
MENSTISKILTSFHNIAVVGISDDLTRPSNYVAKYLLSRGYVIIPINPNLEYWEGIKAYASLNSIHSEVEVVCVFRKSEFVPDIAKEAISIGAKAIWMQEGVINKEAANLAIKNGLLVVMDKCMKKEHEKMVLDSKSH